MTGDAVRWEQIRRLFAAALELTARERAPFLSRACGGDEALRLEVASLLAAHDASGPVDRLSAELAGTIEQVQTHSAPEPGAVVAHYTILDLLGAGGMGVVYRARDEQLQRPIALKFLPPHRVSDGSLKRRFLTEARAIAALDHPNVCTIYEIGETPKGQLYIAMPLYEGETLQACLSRGALPVERAVAIARGMAAGLGAAHDRGIVHRDVKPSNVMLLHDGRVKILDFGIAKVKGLTVTGTGEQIGTLAYMSPEQVSGEGVDHRADVWALGAVLYEMLAGRVAGARSYVPASELRDDIPSELEDLIAMATARLPERRFASMADVAAALAVIEQGFAAPARSIRPTAADRRTVTAAPGQTPAPERRRAVVVVSRIAHHDAMVEHLCPEDLAEMAAAVRETVVDVVRRHGGLVNAADGEEIVALFGIPASHEDDDLRAVKAALELHARVVAINTPGLERLQRSVVVQTGIDSGSVVAQRLRDGGRRYSIAGASAQAAARLATLAAPGTILISPGCHRLVEPFVLAEPAPPVSLHPSDAPI